MTPFTYARAADVQAALRAASGGGARFIGGGTNLVDLMREGIERPGRLIDVSGLSSAIEYGADGSLRIGGAATNTDVAAHPMVRRHFPLLAQAIVHGASGQIRNMATVAGNLLQRTRCLYFYDHAARCNKRRPGAGCDAIEGENRMHAILGASAHCVATHPSDMCVALAALGATVQVESLAGGRAIDFAAFHRLPGDRPEVETALRPDELITGIEIAAQPAGARSGYRKVRERASYAFALVSVAAMLEVEDGAIRQARLALGGVAAKPWRATEAEAALQGARATAETFAQAAALALRGAEPLSHNAFKIALAERVIAATLGELAGPEGSA